MAQWRHQFSERTHSSRVRDREEILANAIATWNSTLAVDRTPSLRKKLLRLADDLLAAILKEKRAYLDRTTLDKHSKNYQLEAKQILALQECGGVTILRTMGAEEY